MNPLDRAGNKIVLNDFVLVESPPERPYLDVRDVFYGDLQPTMRLTVGSFARVKSSMSGSWHDANGVYVIARVLDDQALKDVPLIVPASDLVVLAWREDLMAYFVDIDISASENCGEAFSVPFGSERYDVFSNLQKRLSKTYGCRSGRSGSPLA